MSRRVTTVLFAATVPVVGAITAGWSPFQVAVAFCATLVGIVIQDIAADLAKIAERPE